LDAFSALALQYFQILSQLAQIEEESSTTPTQIRLALRKILNLRTFIKPRRRYKWSIDFLGATFEAFMAWFRVVNFGRSEVYCPKPGARLRGKVGKS